MSLLTSAPTARRYLESALRRNDGLRVLLASVLVLMGIPSGAAAATFTASLDRDTISVAESATLSLRFEGGMPADVPTVPNVPGLSISRLGQSSQFNFINGQASSIVSHNFQVRAAQPGDYTIPSISVLVDGKTLASQPLKLKVLKSGEPTPESDVAGHNASLKLLATKNEVFLGEVLPVEVRLLARQGNLKQPAPQLNQDGFTIGRMIQLPLTKTLIGNQYFSSLVYKTFVIPARTGKLTLGPATLLLAVPRPNARVNLFGEVIDWMDANLTTDPLTVQVRPLPTNNVPPDFNGAVGNYSLNVSLSTNVVTAGDPITLTVQIAGHGPIESLSLSSLDQWRDFKVYPPISRVETTDQFGLDGSKTFEQVVIPENAEVKVLPAVTFSFFDPEKQGYRTVRQPPTPITVRPGNAAPAQPTIVATASQDSTEAKPATDIVHIKPRLGTLAELRPPLIQQTWFVALQSVPLLVWLCALLWRRREESLANNPRRRRQRQVAQTVRDGLAQLRRSAAENQSEEFFATVFRLLQEQLGERLDLPASAITEAVVDERLRPRGVALETLASLQSLFQACNQARYAPQRSGQELASLAPKVESALQQLQRLNLDEPGVAPQRSLLGQQGRKGESGLVALLCLLLTTPGLTRAGDVASAFELANRLYEQGRFADATAAYEKIIGQGRVSPALYFNLGNALFKSGQIGRAIVNYRLAGQLAPRDPDIRANLRFARNHVEGADARPAAWWRRWTGHLTLNEWTGLVAVAAWLWFILLALPQWRPALKKPLRGYTATAGLVAAFLSVCLALNYYDRFETQSAIVVAREAVVRYGPLEESQSYYAVRDGVELTVLDAKGDWVQVTDRSKRTGWVRREEVLLFPNSHLPASPS